MIYEPDPRPVNMRAELTSGGNHEKSRTITTPPQLPAPMSPHRLNGYL